ncbi:MAG: hypothetical protein EBS21_09175, partial [Sphingomonadaceae bacterium]|nr:hypothetical protein [Sphingomonadaceae bacterium]
EQLDRGKMTLSTELKVSAHAQRQAPSKLGVSAGDTITVEDAIKALVTRSANDVASVIAENIGGTESNFAQLMTRKARKPDQWHIGCATARCKPILQRKPRLITQKTGPIPASANPRNQIRHLCRVLRLQNLQRVAIKPRGRATRTGIIQKHKWAGRNGRCHAPPLAGLAQKDQTGTIRDGTDLRPPRISPILLL